MSRCADDAGARPVHVRWDKSSATKVAQPLIQRLWHFSATVFSFSCAPISRKKKKAAPFGAALGVTLLSGGYRPSNASTLWGELFACESTDVLACTRIC